MLPKSDEEVLTVPICLDFDQSKSVGWLSINRSALPLFPNYVFSLGYLAKDTDGWINTPGDIQEFEYLGDYDLLMVSPIEDVKYIAYLKQVGKT